MSCILRQSSFKVVIVLRASSCPPVCASSVSLSRNVCVHGHGHGHGHSHGHGHGLSAYIDCPKLYMCMGQ